MQTHASQLSNLAYSVQQCLEQIEAWPGLFRGTLTILIETQLIDLDGTLWFQGCSSLVS